MLLQPGSAQGSEGSAGEDAWMGSGSRVTDSCWDTSPKMAWASWVVEGCVRMVWQHEKRWCMRKKMRREFWMLKIHAESLL